ncbi:hypothetical protein JYU34_016662 [Plutella xylostella]|uniref:Elongation of very long chain fatty acids protein n=1 Tax=Plutella xylostella TaxID=51655 RepID=A0ABQ7Q4J7_PLUXY|nr:hypothetical protein JYU34_016662 [Plutella xylostella]
MDTSYDRIFENFGNVQNVNPTEAWTLADTGFGLFFVLVAYLVIVLVFLPDFMATRQPYKLNTVLLVYNALQVAYSVYLVFIYARYMLKHGIITTRCPKGDDLQQVINEIKPYFIAKHIDLLDTVFFVLRKKDNQVTFLHLYHHTTMVSWTWLHLMYHPTDNFVVVGLINSFVHVLMYAYYGIAALGPDYAKYIWWKKHLTTVQLIQFIMVVSNLHFQQKWSPCPIPGFFHYFCLFLICSFFALFMRFYFQSYKTQMKMRAEKIREEKKLLAD